MLLYCVILRATRPLNPPSSRSMRRSKTENGKRKRVWDLLYHRNQSPLPPIGRQKFISTPLGGGIVYNSVLYSVRLVIGNWNANY